MLSADVRSQLNWQSNERKMEHDFRKIISNSNYDKENSALSRYVKPDPHMVDFYDFYVLRIGVSNLWGIAARSQQPRPPLHHLIRSRRDTDEWCRCSWWWWPAVADHRPDPLLSRIINQRWHAHACIIPNLDPEIHLPPHILLHNTCGCYTTRSVELVLRASAPNWCPEIVS